MSAKPNPRSASRLVSAAPSSSAVDSRTVAKRQSLRPALARRRCRGASACCRRRRPAACSRPDVQGTARRVLRPGPRSRQRVGRAPGPGTSRSGVELEQRHEHEPPRGDLAVRQRQPLGRVLRSPEQQQVDVDRPRPVLDVAVLAADCARTRARPPCRRPAAAPASARSRPAGTRCRTRAGRAPRPPARSRRPTRTTSTHDVVRPQQLDRRLQVHPPVADVGAQPQVADLAHAREQSGEWARHPPVPIAEQPHQGRARAARGRSSRRSAPPPPRRTRAA